MNPSLVTFLTAAVILIVVRLGLQIAGRRGHPFFEDVSDRLQRWNLPDLLLASFLTLFAELAFIRWIAVEVRVFAYFKNLALLLCFVGFGLGCALVNEKVRWSLALKAFLGLILVIRFPFNGSALERLSQSLGGAGDVEIWGAGDAWNWLGFTIGALQAGTLFLLIVLIFVPLGQTVSRQMNLAPRTLLAYSWNLLGSLAGILVFLAVSQLMLPPSVWLGAILLGFAFLQSSRKDSMLVASLVVPLILLLRDPAQVDSYVMWTPYQQIQYTRYYTRNGDFGRGMVWVNHTGYQSIVNLSPEFLARHPGLVKEPLDENPYNVPFRFAVTSPSVLVVGAGAGNDVAGALRHGSRSVDAVEIDPAILALGRREHPEHPYDSPRVATYLTDARRFVKRTPKQYDLILFGLLDSHTQFSDYSNMRIDNFVYTEDSFREARQHLSANGVMFVKFQIDRPWMAARLAQMLNRTFGRPPLVFRVDSTYTSKATCFVVSVGSRVEQALVADLPLSEFARKHEVLLSGEPIPATTDDWPYLYQEGRWIPRIYYSVGLLVILLALGLYSRIGGTVRRLPSAFFFFMGAGFLLLETQVISRLALFFGTIWQVNGIVISALLVALLFANLVVERCKASMPRAWILAALLLGLAIAYYFPFHRIPGSPAFVGTIATVVFGIPVMFAGILFALEFRAAASPSAALGANMLGAVAGGLLENLSLLFGMRALLLVAMVLYCLAGLRLWRERWHGRTSMSARIAPIRDAGSQHIKAAPRSSPS
jgi:hypothetical protein